MARFDWLSMIATTTTTKVAPQVERVSSMTRNRATLLACLAALAVAAVSRTSARSSAPAKIRIGVYDNRAIAIAWASSALNPVRTKMAELEAARKAGDQQKVKELEAWGPASQRLLHFQGFGRVPVGDLLEPVKAGVARVAAARGLAAIAMQCDHVAANAEVVDVTSDLVELYTPSDRTRKVVESMRSVKPMGLLELADLKDKD